MHDEDFTRWVRVDALFAEVLTRPPDDRLAFVRASCGDDRALEREVLAMLDSLGSAEAAIGESVGLARFTAAAAQALWARLGAQIEAGQTRVYYELAFEQLIAAGWQFHISDVTGLVCMEIDTPEDLAAAHALAEAIDRLPT